MFSTRFHPIISPSFLYLLHHIPLVYLVSLLSLFSIFGKERPNTAATKYTRLSCLICQQVAGLLLILKSLSLMHATKQTDELYISMRVQMDTLPGQALSLKKAIVSKHLCYFPNISSLYHAKCNTMQTGYGQVIYKTSSNQACILTLE